MAKVNFQSLFQKGVYGSIRSKSTIKTYIHNVRDAFEYILEIPKHRLDNIKITRKLLHKLINIPIDIIKDKLTELPLRTKKRIVNILIVLSVALRKEKNLKDYRAYLEELRNTLQKVVDKNLPNDKQKANWITMDEFDKIIVDLTVKVDKIFSDKIFEKGQLNEILLLIVLKLYRTKFLRNDFSSLLIITPKAYEKLRDNTKKNYVILTKNKRNIVKITIVLNNFKTKKVYQQQVIDFDNPELMELITKYLKVRPKSRWLLVNQQNKPLTSRNFSMWFSRQMKRLTNGKSIGSSLLRHIFCSRNVGEGFKNLEERKKESNSMMHSLAQAEEYVLDVR